MNKSFDEKLREITIEARDQGYAITWWSPDEVQDVDTDTLIDIVIERGNNFIESTKEQ